ncbi:MAG: helicase-related protein, partial [bacterium]|nr:helicase-related protein [bacterium]
LGDLSLVIIDEVHAVFGNRRGVLLSSSIERLTDFSGEFQRVGLSATVNPIAKVAEFVGGFFFDSAGETYTPRPVAIVQDSTRKSYDLSVYFPEERGDEKIWEPILDESLKHIDQNRSTLLFANSRRLAETLTKGLNDRRSEMVAYAHHGAMSRDIREEVEQRFKNGHLKAIVATSTLEMGIDIGDLDEVLMVQCPGEVSSAIQRIGRSKHQVGAVSKGLFLPTHATDILEAAVLVRAIENGDVEEMRPVRNALDVLAQIIISIVAHQKMNIDDLYNGIRRSYSYQTLGREDFNLILDLLGGRFQTSRIRELKTRVSADRLDNTIALMPHAETAIYASGGVIPDRGYYKLRLGEGGQVLGELDEEFVWEAERGKKFAFGNNAWQIEKITHNDVIVSRMAAGKPALPFWKGEGMNRSFHYANLIGEFLEEADREIRENEFELRPEHNPQLTKGALGELTHLLASQMRVTGRALPHRHHILIEQMASGPGGVPGHQVVIHNFWGNRVNYPYSLALQGALEEKYGCDVEMYPHNNCVVMVLADEIESDSLLGLVRPENLDRYLRPKMESSGYFGARFRECASRALLIERHRIGVRMPLFMSRLKSQKLLSKVMKYEDFPILLEAWRSCLQDEFEMDALRMLLGELDRGEMTWSTAQTTRPSPFAEVVSWRQINQYMYMSDALGGSGASNLSDELIEKLIKSPHSRPIIPKKVVDEFERKRQLLYEGYAPRDDVELLEWLKERIVIPKPEWDALLSAMVRDHGVETEVLSKALAPKISVILPGLLSAKESMTQGFLLCADQEKDLTGFEECLCDWLSYYGTLAIGDMLAKLRVAGPILVHALTDLEEAGLIVRGKLTEGSQEVYCERENYEILLRLNRRNAQPDFEPLPAAWLQVLLAQIHGLTTRQARDVGPIIDRLLCYPVDPQILETEVLAARQESYSPHQLDALLQSGSLAWTGHADKKVSFCYKNEMDLYGEDRSQKVDEAVNLFSDPHAKYDFNTLTRKSGLPAQKLVAQLWQAVWSGQVANDGYDALRKGVQSGYKLPNVAMSRNRQSFRRSARAEWNGALPMGGNWYVTASKEGDRSLLDEEECSKERVRVLFDRYGILFKEMLKNEGIGFRWQDIFRTLRLMELAGEVLTGYFFEGIAGPQFVTPATWGKLRKGLGTGNLFWIHAQDPASLCGVSVEGLSLPARVKTTHLVFLDDQLILVARRSARLLAFSIPHDHPLATSVNAFFFQFLTREVSPLPKIVIESINGEPAASSAFAVNFESVFEARRNGHQLLLFRKRW